MVMTGDDHDEGVNMTGNQSALPQEATITSCTTANPVTPNGVTYVLVQEEDINHAETLDDPLLLSDNSYMNHHHHQSRNNIPPYYALRRRLVSDESCRSARELVRRSGNYLAYITLLTMLIVIPNVLYRTLRNRKLDQAAFHSARIMVMGTIVLSLRLVYLHLTHWYMPQVQKYVVRILCMVPIYAIQSWLSLRYHEGRIYFDTIRDFYEAFVIASFVYYLIELLGGQDTLVQILQQKNETQPHLGQHKFPLSLILEPWELGLDFLLQCKHGVLQYVVFKVVSTFVTFVCAFVGVYGEGKFTWFVAYPYLTFMQNIAVMYALYCLVMLYHAVNEELRHPFNWRPLGKFLCIKGVVFFCWWQGVLIFYLRAHGIIGNLGSWSSEEVAYGLIDYCIVVEMIGFAIAHNYTFTYKEYLPGNVPHRLEENLDNGVADDADGDNRVRVCTSNGQQKCAYQPPATLPHPMKFSDAFWSSALPDETLRDIQRLRPGFNNGNNTRSGSVSLQEILESELDQEPGVESTFVLD